MRREGGVSVKCRYGYRCKGLLEGTCAFRHADDAEEHRREKRRVIARERAEGCRFCESGNCWYQGRCWFGMKDGGVLGGFISDGELGGDGDGEWSVEL